VHLTRTEFVTPALSCIMLNRDKNLKTCDVISDNYFEIKICTISKNDKKFVTRFVDINQCSILLSLQFSSSVFKR
jgi:hypothetical protein